MFYKLYWPSTRGYKKRLFKISYITCFLGMKY